MTRMTKAQLVDENIRLRAQCDVLERQVAGLQELSALKGQELRAQNQVPGRSGARSQVRVAVQSVPNCSRSAYYDYVANCRRIQRERGMRTVSYLSFNDWVANITARDEVYS